MNVLENPEFISLAMKAQHHFAKARNMHDDNTLAGQFAVIDMLAMLDKQMEKDKRNDLTR